MLIWFLVGATSPSIAPNAQSASPQQPATSATAPNAARPTLPRQDSTRKPDWINKPRPGSQRIDAPPEAASNGGDVSPHKTRERALNIGVRAAAEQSDAPAPAPIPAAASPSNHPPPHAVHPSLAAATAAASRPASNSSGAGAAIPPRPAPPARPAGAVTSLNLAEAKTTESSDMNKIVSPRKLSKLQQANAPKPKDFEQSRRRMMAKVLSYSFSVVAYYLLTSPHRVVRVRYIKLEQHDGHFYRFDSHPASRP